MPLTVTVGASGSGKTTFLNDVHKSHKCTYIRQYHQIRPYLKVSNIPSFDPTQLPYWGIYVKEEKADSIQVGGTMAGEFTAGLSGGQRKLLLFELIYQRTMNQKDLLIVLDEPFAGVTDDFVPFITDRLQKMRDNHNLLVVTNDHVKVLTDMADNTITVSAIDRTTVQINEHLSVDRDMALHAMSLGEAYKYDVSSSEVKFFWNTEIKSKAVITILVSIIIFFGLFIATYWDSSPGNESLVLVGGGILTYFAVQPYLLALADWRNINKEEGDALLHSSVSRNKTWKTLLTTGLCLLTGFVYYGCINAVIDTLRSPYYLFAIICEIVTLTFPMVFVGLYTTLPFELVQIVGSSPFLLMIFFSTTFSPGSGIPGVKGLRYLFPRFYLWCEVPDVQSFMEGCPDTRGLNMVCLFLTSMIFFAIFLPILAFKKLKKNANASDVMKRRESMAANEEYVALQKEMYGDTEMKRSTTSGSGSDSFNDN